MAVRKGPVLVLNLFSNGAYLQMDAPAHGAQKKSCFGVEFIFEIAPPFLRMPQPMIFRTGPVLVLNLF